MECHAINKEIPIMDTMSSTPVMEVDSKHRSHLPIAAQIGLRLMANESLLQQTPFLITERDLIPNVLATEIGMDPEKSQELELVKNGIAQLREGHYLGSATVDLPVDTENFRHEIEEVTDKYIQLMILPAFEHIMRGTVENAQQVFSSDD